MRTRAKRSAKCPACTCLLWWAYFDWSSLLAEHRFRESTGVAQLRIACDAYALGHGPMIAGIVLFALGVKKVLEHTGDPLKEMPAVALCGGLALYLLAHVGFRLRNVGSVSRPRILAAAAMPAVTSCSEAPTPSATIDSPRAMMTISP